MIVMGTKSALEALAKAAGADLSEVRAIRYIARVGRVDVSTSKGTVRVEVKDEPKKAPAKKTAAKKPEKD